MRVVLQRAKKANVKVDNEIIGEIEKGIVIFLGISLEDAIHLEKIDKTIDKVIDKLINLRVFEDTDNKMNLSTLDIGGEILVISNFTIYADASKGTRPSYSNAAKSDDAIKIYDRFIERLKQTEIKKVATGEFGADMEVEVINDGPVTIIYEF